MTNQELIQKANEFLTKYNSKKQIPVPIEEIVELSCNFKVISAPGLKELLETDSYICIDQRIIVIDDLIYRKYQSRSRFSYAHEIAHFCLHRDLEGFSQITTRDDYKNFQISISNEERKRIEYQAYRFAGYVLLPRDIFNNEVNKFIESFGGVSIMTLGDLAKMCPSLCEAFNVSELCLLKQLELEFPELIKQLKTDDRPC